MADVMGSLRSFVIGLVYFLWVVYQCLQTVCQFIFGENERRGKKVPVTFIRTIIDKFNGQRQVGDQFAVVVLSSETELRNIGRMRFRPCDASNNPLVDSHHTLSPQHQYGNYIVARPDKVHAEEIILSEFDSLLNAYSRNPTYIMLYSWMMPCSDCTSAIIALCNSHLNSQIIVVYTIDWKEISDEENETNRARLCAVGIIVQKVRYHPRLPPA